MSSNPYAHLVAEYARFFREGKAYPLGGFTPPTLPPTAPGAPTALIFSPHPDDECIIGALALRLRGEAGWNVRNVAVTQGSNRARQAARWQELQDACNYLGLGLIPTAPSGLEQITPKARTDDPAGWRDKVAIIAQILATEAPRAVFVPHARDWNGTHIGVHHLVLDALATLPPQFTTHFVETEYWGQMTQPNLMVEVGEALLTDQVTALSFHVGEVRRNPFHLLLPAWMQDNVRRGSELVGGQGGNAPDFGFATLYRARVWRHGRLEESFSGGRNLARGRRAGHPVCVNAPAIPPPLELEDGRILLRPLGPDDAPAVFAAVVEDGAELARWMMWVDLAGNVEATRQFLRDRSEAWPRGEAFNFAIVDAADGRLLGACGLSQINWAHRLANVLYWIRGSERGHGLAPAAVRLLAHFGLRHAALHRLEILVEVPNLASQRVAEKSGARREGVLRGRINNRGQPRDAVVYSLLPGDLD